MFENKGNIKPFENKVWLSSPTMHGDEQKWVTDAFVKNWLTTAGENINEVERLYRRTKSNFGTLHGHKIFCSDMTFDATVNLVAYEDEKAVVYQS